MKVGDILNNDIQQMSIFFPKLALINNNGRAPSFAGSVDIGDPSGYNTSFSIKIRSSPTYPFGVPILVETGGRIDRVPDRHISEQGVCCVAIDHELLYKASKGLTTFEYMKSFAYPFLVNQLFYEAEGHFAGTEHKHGWEGIQEFYSKTLAAPNASVAIKLIAASLTGESPGRNEQCFCGQNLKYKRCHQPKVEYLSCLGTERLNLDLTFFQRKISESINNKIVYEEQGTPYRYASEKGLYTL